MTNLSKSKPKLSFWIISGIVLVWNLLGVFAYLRQAYLTDEAKAMLPESEQAYYNNVPMWVTAAFAIAVFAGTLGCLGLLLRKKWANPIFIISFISVIVQFVYTFFIQKFVVISINNAIMPLLVIVIAAFLVWFSKDAIKKQLLN